MRGRAFSLGSTIAMKRVRRGRQGGYHIVNEALDGMVLQDVYWIWMWKRGTRQCIRSVEVLTSNVTDIKSIWVIGWTAALAVGESPSWLCSSAEISTCGQSWGRCASPKHSLGNSPKPRRVWEPLSRSASSTVQCLPYTWRWKQPVSNYPCVAKAVQLLALKLMHLQISLHISLCRQLCHTKQWFDQLLLMCWERCLLSGPPWPAAMFDQ